MSEEFSNEQDELDVKETAAEVTEAAEETLEAAEDAVEEADAPADEAEAGAAELVENAEEIEDPKVEAAVRNVAEEAEAESQEAEEPKKRERRSKQARAAKADPAKETVSARPAPAKLGVLDTLSSTAWIAISVAALVLGILLGKFALAGGAGGGSLSLDGRTAVSESELDDAFATYTYGGKKGTITIRQAIEQAGTVDSMLDEEGNYKLPSAEYALAAARTAIIDQEIEAKGITVADEEVTAYAEESLGTSDFDAIASAYGMDAEQVEALILENCKMNALREQVVGEKQPVMPDAPEAAEEGKEGEATKDYADYIIKLAGDEWDADKGEWASKESRYATALADYDFSADGATYEAAQSAYYLAYQIYTEKQTEQSSTWTDYLNGLLSNANIQVGTLVS